MLKQSNTENFTKAANSLYDSQPAHSKAIQNLEIELNAILIDRSQEFKLTRRAKKSSLRQRGPRLLPRKDRGSARRAAQKEQRIKAGNHAYLGCDVFLLGDLPFLHQGAVVTTSRNDVDYVVTEYGIAWLRALTVAERAEALIRIAAS